MKRAKVYIAGPYSQDPVQGTRTAMVTWAMLWYEGFTPVCPHWTMFQHFLTPMPYETWLEYDREFVPICDAVLRLQGESSGADQEVALAKELGIPVFMNIEDLNKFFDEQKPR
jgi:Domain of unknown function (DUF4406)